MLQADTSNLLPRLLTIIVTLSGVALLGWQSRQLYLQMTRLPAATHRAPAPRGDTDPALLERLFGVAAGNATARLQGVTLLGCIVAANPAQSQALLRIEGLGAVTVSIGDEFLPGTRATQITHDHVVFQRAGSSGRLEFDADNKAVPREQAP
ncbi:type II secretion system protein N [Stenotrophomonas sp.]|uniref:type II secretion system protein N n=1 Tax=Stenotrophomonas sp. TaxID=69392 RepID=UPI0028A8E7F4|nr:type II secretion system protein N [Stenotrophomonas sp.]